MVGINLVRVIPFCADIHTQCRNWGDLANLFQSFIKLGYGLSQREVCFGSSVFEWVVEFGSMLTGHYKQDMKLVDIEEEYFDNILAWDGEI
ncbi:hypothetical protein KY284_020382 [Solanum tuberosum]|nr:hypothetical protein KY284_020382 [Solanum tuberosum]